ncbi:hypothetical protein E2K80_13160 [Rhodophyticola sp. CCM32]|uniref:hypothetical protein n=1 Tax=Rhodophyticola sp. CCM32 TaxID=2916397 RepID=UPI00107FADE9|nr:hypothetical protein [Rhodophyticola sp. CCM32]QBY01555.1 hypothetical protein E2K80_13160 [Rhodophyticola sp. CCM32]
MLFRTLLILTFLGAAPLSAQPVEPLMSVERMLGILLALDPEARPEGRGVELTLGDVPVRVVMDPRANRMRAMVPVASADGLSEADLTRIMQANFDTALDARYAIAQGRLWSVYIHPLEELGRDQLISGIGQAVNLARSYGTLYTSGAQIYGRGDSADIYTDLIEDLLDRGAPL